MECDKLLMFTKDGIKFVQNFAGIIDKSTPHLYFSALLFSPSKSILARSLNETFAAMAQVACNGLVFFFISNQRLDYILSYRM